MEDLCQRIASHRIIVLYAASGTGKSSLLRAGVFPLLRKGGYLPLSVRFNPRNRSSLTSQLAAEVTQECERQRAHVFDGRAEARSFLRYFQEAEFWGEDGPMTPVLVLDQFEELFYLHSFGQREELMEELAALIKGSVSSRVLKTGDDASLPTSLATSSSRADEHASSLRVVLSLREDAIGHLLALGTQIPGLMTHAFRLDPLSPEAAKKAITLPAAEQLDARYVPAFDCQQAAVNDLVGWLAEKLRLEIGDVATRPTGNVESFVLQIFCERIEEHVIAQHARGEAGAFTTDLFPQAKNKERVLQAYYHRKFVQFLRIKGRKEAENVPLQISTQNRRLDTLGDRSWPFRLLRSGDHVETALAAQAAMYQVIRRPRLGWRLLQLLENDLLTKDGRRQPGDRDNLKKIRRLTDNDVALLETMRLIRTEPHGGTQLLNLSHDQLAAAIHHHSILRQLRQLFYVYGTGFVMALVFFMALRERTRADEAVQARTLAIESQIEASKANAATARLAKLTAQRAGTEGEAISSLALAVQADPLDDEAFYDLLGRVLNFDLALPQRLWTGAGPGGECPNCSIVMDEDGRHFVVIAGDKATVWDSSTPTKQPLWSVSTSPPRLAIGRGGKSLVGLAPEKRSQEKKVPMQAKDDVGWQFVFARQEEDKGDLRRVSAIVLKDIGSKPVLELSPNARWIVVAATASGASSKSVYELEKNEIKLLPPLPVAQTPVTTQPQPSSTPGVAKITAVAFHPADTLLAAIDSQTRCWLWQPAKSAWENLSQSGATRAIFSSDGDWLTLLSDKPPRVWSVSALERGDANSQELDTAPLAGNGSRRATNISFSPHTRLLVTDELVWPPGQDPNSTTASDFMRILWERKDTSFSLGTRIHGSSRYYNSLWISQRRKYPISSRALSDTFRTIGESGRWGLEDDRVIDLTGAVRGDRFRIFGQTSIMPDEARASVGPSVAVVSTEAIAGVERPFLRQVIKDGSVAEWPVAASQRLRVDWQLLGGRGRQAWLSSDGQSVLIWDPVTFQVWISDPGAVGTGSQPVLLAGAWQPLNVTSKQWLVARTIAEPTQLAVWDMKSGRQVANNIALPENASPPSAAAEVGVSKDGRYLALLYEKEDEIENYVAWIDLQAGRLSPWSSGQPSNGPIDFAHGKMITTPPNSSSYQIISVYPPATEPQSLPGLAGENQQLFLHGEGQRITIFSQEKDKVSSQTIHYHDKGWQFVTTPPLAGRGEPNAIAESDDGQWLVGVENDVVLAWRIFGKNSEKRERAPLLRLDLRLRPASIASVAFCPHTHRLAIGVENEIGLVDLDAWVIEASATERQAFADFAASFASVTLMGSHLAESKDSFVEPAAVLWNTFRSKSDKSSTSLSKLVEWWLGRTMIARPHPFTAQSLTDWAAMRRDAGTLESVRDALEVIPDDAVSLAMYGWLVAKKSEPNETAGYWNASFYYALHQPNLKKSDEVAVYAYQAKAWIALGQPRKALEAVAAGEKAATDGDAQTNQECRALLQEAKTEAQRIPP
jgi:hypothetical protein